MIMKEKREALDYNKVDNTKKQGVWYSKGLNGGTLSLTHIMGELK